MHTRFFQHLKEDRIITEPLEWDEVNPKDGVWGLWWHGLKDKPLAKEKLGFATDSSTEKYMDDLYLQIEHTSKGAIIALKYSVDEGKLDVADWDIVQEIRWALYHKMKEYFDYRNDVPYQKKPFHRGAFMSVGYVTYDMTNYKDRIQAMQKALDRIVDRYHYVIGKGFEENP